MDRSASLPASGFDYQLPRHGVGQTGLARKVVLGNVSKDKGTYSSRINQIIRQAEKVPGPGTYVGHEDWSANGGFKFAAVERTYKPHNKVPDPSHYERTDIMDKQSMKSKDVLSTNPRTLYGKMSTGKKRSFLDQAENHAKTLPGAGHYEPKQTSCDRLDPKLKGTVSWEKEVGKTPKRSQPVKELGPDQYYPSQSQVHERSPNYTVSKEKSNNFIDKSVKEKLVDLRTRKEMPGPGTYNMDTFNDDKISRGTRHLQLRGLSRSPLSGYF